MFAAICIGNSYFLAVLPKKYVVFLLFLQSIEKDSQQFTICLLILPLHFADRRYSFDGSCTYFKHLSGTFLCKRH